jgi:hypothetical protein
MAGLMPIVRYLIVCEDVLVDSHNTNRLTLVNLISFILSGDHPFPIRHPELCVFLQLRGCRGPGEGRIQVVFADTDALVFSTSTRQLPLGSDPLELASLFFRIRDCPFPEPGMYQVQFWYNGEVLAQEYLIVR